MSELVAKQRILFLRSSKFHSHPDSPDSNCSVLGNVLSDLYFCLQRPVNQKVHSKIAGSLLTVGTGSSGAAAENISIICTVRLCKSGKSILGEGGKLLTMHLNGAAGAVLDVSCRPMW